MPLIAEDFQKLWLLSQEEDFLNDCGFPEPFEEWLKQGDIEQLTKSLIQSYQERCYGPLNDYLREEKRESNPLYDLRIKLLTQALEHLPAISTKFLWRDEGNNDEVKQWASKNIGKTFLVPSFWSAYIEPENWKATTPTFRILASSPSNAKNISAYSGFQLGETEALYKPNTLFKLVDIKQVVTWGNTVAEVVTIKELESGEPNVVAFEGYTISQDDADHSSLSELSASDLGLI